MKIDSTILILSACYLLMLVTVVVLKKITSPAGRNLEPANLNALNNQHMILLSLMVAASCMIKPLPYFLLEFPDAISIGQLAAFLITFGTISFIPWKHVSRDVGANSENGHSPQATITSIARYVLVRSAFLVTYEWFFRALLLVTVSAYVGIKWAIAINVVLYTAVHIHKDKKEILGCLPFGLLLCVFTVWWQSIWPAIIFHVQLATVNEWPLLQKFISPQKQNAL